MVCIDGFLFRFGRHNKDGTTTYRCVVEKSGCKAMIRTLGDMPFEVCGPEAHNHWAMPEVVAKKKATEEVKVRALDTAEPPRKIRHICQQDLPDDVVTAMPSASAIRQTISTKRKQAMGVPLSASGKGTTRAARGQDFEWRAIFASRHRQGQGQNFSFRDSKELRCVKRLPRLARGRNV